ncbi:uncharacterized protein LOC121387837 [Gigantopelta aegis]|uniref:uncharacterized protein LOC121387837 n=1 Tax=Gigantopelta aegis TaxID=1735272 RepID=UPI001B88BE8D|nr:uncharacterized protein LOC121387837 [Gigantopelta aegis]
MLATQIENGERFLLCDRPKRSRSDSTKHYDFNGSGPRCLELQDVIRVTKQYEDSDGGMNCSLCGKLYKSRVCFIKHIWEHTVYWDLFDGSKNQDRVLSIQAALILHSGHVGVAIGNNKTLSNLLVTTPASPEKKILSPERKAHSAHRQRHSMLFKPERRTLKTSSLKRKRSD